MEGRECALTLAVLSCEALAINLSFGEMSRELISWGEERHQYTHT